MALAGRIVCAAVGGKMPANGRSDATSTLLNDLLAVDVVMAVCNTYRRLNEGINSRESFPVEGRAISVMP